MCIYRKHTLFFFLTKSFKKITVHLGDFFLGNEIFFLLNFFFFEMLLESSRLTINVVGVTGVEQSDSILFSPYRLSHTIEETSLCATGKVLVNSLFYAGVCMCHSHPSKTS